MPNKKTAADKLRSVSYYKTKAWEAFSKYIRTRDCLKTMRRKDWGKCYTCGILKEFKGLQAGHFIPGRKNSYLFDEEMVRAQCYHCNVGLNGNWPEYYKAMVQEIGQKRVDEMINKKWETKQFKAHEVKEIWEKYKLLLDQI